MQVTNCSITKNITKTVISNHFKRLSYCTWIPNCPQIMSSCRKSLILSSSKGRTASEAPTTPRPMTLSLDKTILGDSNWLPTDGT